MRIKCVVLWFLVAVTAPAVAATPVVMPPEIGAAYGRLGKAITSHDVESVTRVWADDVIVDAPSNPVLHRDEVMTAMASDLLE